MVLTRSTRVLVTALSLLLFVAENGIVARTLLPGSSLAQQPAKMFSSLSPLNTDRLRRMQQWTQGLSQCVVSGAVISANSSTLPVYLQAQTSDYSGTPFDEHSLFAIGSMTKVLTAVSAQYYALLGSLRMSDPISKFIPLPFTSPLVAAITLRELASHTSGLAVLPSNMQSPLNMSNPYGHYTVQNMLTYLTTLPSSHLGPKRYCYSNAAFGLLGYILTLVSGHSYEETIKRSVLIPLGMLNTTITLSAQQRSELMPGTLNGITVADWTFTDATAGAGAFRSTAADVAIFLSVLLRQLKQTDSFSASASISSSKSLLRRSRRTLSSAFSSADARSSISLLHKAIVMGTLYIAPDDEISPSPPPPSSAPFSCPTGPSLGNPNLAGVGEAWDLLYFNATRMLWKNGAVGGYNSIMLLHPASDTAIVLLTNTASSSTASAISSSASEQRQKKNYKGHSGDIAITGYEMLDPLDLFDPPACSSPSPSPSLTSSVSPSLTCPSLFWLESFVGVYTFPASSVNLTVTLSSSSTSFSSTISSSSSLGLPQLYVQLGQQTSRPLIPISPFQFKFNPSLPAAITFLCFRPPLNAHAISPSFPSSCAEEAAGSVKYAMLTENGFDQFAERLFLKH